MLSFDIHESYLKSSQSNFVDFDRNLTFFFNFLTLDDLWLVMIYVCLESAEEIQSFYLHESYLKSSQFKLVDFGQNSTFFQFFWPLMTFDWSWYTHFQNQQKKCNLLICRNAYFLLSWAFIVILLIFDL